jgi:hypothetical protein
MGSFANQPMVIRYSPAMFFLEPKKKESQLEVLVGSELPAKTGIYQQRRVISGAKSMFCFTPWIWVPLKPPRLG